MYDRKVWLHLHPMPDWMTRQQFFEVYFWDWTDEEVYFVENEDMDLQDPDL